MTRVPSYDMPIRPPISRYKTFTRYVVFAFLAGACNLLSQAFASSVSPAMPLMISIVFGTGIGFLTKYILDKRWIFYDPYQGHQSEARKLSIYGASGIVTTLVFWSVELSSWAVWHTSFAKFTGACVGLMLGNILKYNLDKRFVFAELA